MPKCRCKPKFSTRGRREIKPLFDGPIPDNPEYRALVYDILREKRKRDVIADILEDKRKAA